ncbi:hypothetical protein LC609_24105 [Nostoc sp. XA013]|nr:hypothetical protein [Nostoc sp. XA013]
MRGTKGENLKQVFPLVPNSPCPQVLLPMPNAPCPMPNAPCPMPNAPCPMPNAQCPMPMPHAQIQSCNV